MPMRDKQKSFKDFLKAYSDFTFPSVRRPAPTMHEKAKFCIEYFKEGNVDRISLRGQESGGIHMKVKYIGKSDVSLTNGKIYEVIRIEEGWYRIIDNTEDDYLFNPDEFEVVENEAD